VNSPAKKQKQPGGGQEPRRLKPILLAVSLLFLSVFIFIPLVTIFSSFAHTPAKN
jgi:ABC-type sulfate transport system permease subunit